MFQIALLFTAALVSAQGSPAADRSNGSRLVVLGFDGADSRIVQKLLEEKQLPNLARMRDEGAFFPLRTTNPAQSPVSWAAFNTGMGPDTTNVYDFVCRINRDRETGAPLDTPKPTLSLTYPKNVDADTILPVVLRRPYRALLVAAAGLTLFAVFFLLFRVGAKFPVKISAILSLLLGAGASVAAWSLTRYLPKEVPTPMSERRGTPFWKYLDDNGVATVGIAVPMVFPMPVEDAPHTKILAGLGVPDARQSWGDWFLLCADKARMDALEATGDMGGKYIPLEADPENDRGGAKAYRAVLAGPSNFWLEQKLHEELADIQAQFSSNRTTPQQNRVLSQRKAEITRQLKDGVRATVTLLARPSADKKGISIEIDHKDVQRQGGGDLRAGDWSELTRVKFQFNPLLALSALVAFRVVSVDPLEIFLKPINLDPKAPPITAPISSPKKFSAELASAADVHDFETLGWACATNALKDEAISDETFLMDIERVFAQRERLLFDRLRKKDWRLFYMVFGETDRVQHMMFRYIDPLHPLYNREEAEREVTFFGKRMPVKDTIAEIYRQADKVVGEARNLVADGLTHMMVVSDHGFASFRRGLHLNKWLYSHGYLAVKEGALAGKVKVSDLFDPNRLFGYVDWSKTRAYSLGIGKIYLNVKGRETNGIVEPGEQESLEREIAAKLEADVDPETNRPFVKKAYLARDIYPERGRNMVEGDRDNSEDIVLGFHEGYRVSWDSTLGGFTDDPTDPNLFAKGNYLVWNKHKWSGDHCSVDPSLVTGIFFSTLRLQPPADAPSPDVRHCAPTILRYFGLPIPAGLRAPLVTSP